MNRKRFAGVVAFMLSVCLIGVAHAGPFGLSMGMKASEIPGATPDGKDRTRYSSDTVPKPHDAFDQYVFGISPTLGLCWIGGIGKTIQTNIYGTEMMKAYENLKEQLVRKYGAPANDVNNLRTGSIWNEPQDWMMSLVKKERNLFACWEIANSPDQLSYVELGVLAYDRDRGSVMLKYHFNCIEQMQEETKKEKSDSL